MAANQNDYFVEVGDPGSATTLSSDYTIGDSAIAVTSTTNWPTATGVVFAIDLMGSDGLRIDGTYNVYQGIVTGGTSITSVSHISGTGTDRNYTAGATTRVYIVVSSEIQNRLVTGILTHADQDGTLKAGAVDVAGVLASNVVTYPKLESELQGGWNSTSALPAISAVTANGNRSYTLTHASSIASTVSVGMRRRFTRTVAANTYMGGAFNGSSHYFTKTSPSGTLGTVTNNFTIEAYVQPTSYALGTICARGDAASNNYLSFRMNADGTVTLLVGNGAGNNRELSCYQSLPLNKKTHVAASWTSGTVVMYFDGVSVPVKAAVTNGTAPTTAGTGGDFAIGRLGAASAQYFPGYISNVAVFDAVLTAATIKEHSTIKLLGSETNCIGAWALDNAATDQSSAGNNLTATGGVGYTNIAPFGNGGISSTLEYGLTMSVSSDGLTEVVQCPEGCALPTTGGITASAYSSMANPYGWPQGASRPYWSAMIATNATSSGTALTQASGLILTTPTFATGTKVRVSVTAGYVYNGTSGNSSIVALCDSSISDANTIYRAVTYAPANNTGAPITITTPDLSVSGAKTYCVGIRSGGATTVGLEAGATYLAVLTVELVSF